MSKDTDDQSRVEDKYGKEIKKGDTVHFIYGGAHHAMVVTSIDSADPPDSPYPHILSGEISVKVHAASVTREYRDRKEERAEHEDDPQAAAIDKEQQEAPTPEADHKPAHKKPASKPSSRQDSKPSPKKGSK
jgi:hypothetical protein